MAALMGEIAGAFLALGGIAYIWLGIMWVARVYKRWPRISCWSAVGVVVLIGGTTALSSGQPLLYGAVTVAVSIFVVVREYRALAQRSATVAPT